MQTGRSNLYQDSSQRREGKAAESGCMLKGSTAVLVPRTGAGEKKSSCLGPEIQRNDGVSSEVQTAAGNSGVQFRHVSYDMFVSIQRKI